MKYFKNINNIEELKNKYKELAKKYHPDINPNGLEQMQEINNEYEKMFNMLKLQANQSSNKKDHTTEMPDEFINIINELITLEGLTIEIVGSWIWISGNTYPHKEKLKELKFRWSKNRKKWYLGQFTSYKKNYKRDSWEELKNKHGYQKVESSQIYAIAGY